MLVPGQKITMAWMPTNKDYYIDKGYVFTKMRDTFLVKAEDLPEKSNKKVAVQCDYCGQIYETSFKVLMNGREKGKDCCKECQPLKFADSCKIKFGCDNPFQNKEVKEKIKATNIMKYGVDNPSKFEEFKEKAKKTNLEKFGDSYALRNPEIKAKAESTCLEKYGVTNPFGNSEIQAKIKNTLQNKYGVDNISQSKENKEKVKATNMKRFGVEWSTQSPIVIEKMRQSLYVSGKVPSSSSERKMCQNLIELYGEENCHPNFAYGSVNMDCMLELNRNKIDVEYDGWYWHKDRQEKDKRRNYWLIKQGFKVLRFRANKAVPTKQQLSEAIDLLIKNNKNLICIDLDV